MVLMINSGLHTKYFEVNYNLKIDNKTNIVTSK